MLPFFNGSRGLGFILGMWLSRLLFPAAIGLSLIFCAAILPI